MRSAIINAIAALALLKWLSDLLSGWLPKDKHDQIREFWGRMQTEWEIEGIESLKATSFNWLGSIYDDIFGPRVFSRQSYLRCLVIAPLLLGACLGISGLLLKLPFAMHQTPWVSYRNSLEMLKKGLADQNLKAHAEHVWQNVLDLSQLSGPVYEFIYTAYFALVVAIVVATLFWLSLGLSRLFLREMATTTTLFGGASLIVTNALVVLIMGMSASLLLFLLSNVWTWPYAPLPIAISSWSVLLGGGIAAGASLVLWFVADTWLRVVVLLSLFPLLVTVGALFASWIGVVFRKQINRLIGKILSAGFSSHKGVLSFISSTANFIGCVLMVFVLVISWLTKMSLQLGAAPVFGVDLISLTVFIFLLTLGLAVFSPSMNPTPPVKIGDAALTFFIGFFTVDAGFYIQAIIECFLRPDATAQRDPNLAYDVGLSGAIPASVIAAIATFSSRQKEGVFRSGAKIAAVLVAFDVFNSMRSLDTFRSLMFSIACDIIGGFFASAVILRYRTVFEIFARNIPPTTANHDE